MQCKSCNSFLRPNAKICVSCGSLVNTSEIATAVSESGLVLDDTNKSELVTKIHSEASIRVSESKCHGCGRELNVGVICDRCNPLKNEFAATNKTSGISILQITLGFLSAAFLILTFIYVIKLKEDDVSNVFTADLTSDSLNATTSDNNINININSSLDKSEYENTQSGPSQKSGQSAPLKI